MQAFSNYVNARTPFYLFLIIFLALPTSDTAPVLEDGSQALQALDAGATGCYYNFEHYYEGDRILTNEPCLNCTCHNRMLMCYLRVCPFTKAIGQDCTVEKKPDQCCPVITCPQVHVALLTSSTTQQPPSTTSLGRPDNYGCVIDQNTFYPDGAQVPSDPKKPCELCYCIRNHTACVMQECTLNVEGCKPVYQEGVCCPVRYDCDYEDSVTTQRSTTVGLVTTPGGPSECLHNGEVFHDGEMVVVDNKQPCEHCYCMRGDIVCAVQECGSPLEGTDCTPLDTPAGQCCPTSYQCANGTIPIKPITESNNHETKPDDEASIEDTSSEEDKPKPTAESAEDSSQSESQENSDSNESHGVSQSPLANDHISQEDIVHPTTIPSEHADKNVKLNDEVEEYSENIPLTTENIDQTSSEQPASHENGNSLVNEINVPEKPEDVNLSQPEAEEQPAKEEAIPEESAPISSDEVPAVNHESVPAEPPSVSLTGHEHPLVSNEIPEITTLEPHYSAEAEVVSEDNNAPRVPGEGSCLVGGVTYPPDADVPPKTHSCHKSCKCVNSIVECERVECSLPPSNYANCMPVQTPDSCCPTYMCDQTPSDAPEIQNQLSIDKIDTNVNEDEAVSEENHEEQPGNENQTASGSENNEEQTVPPGLIGTPSETLVPGTDEIPLSPVAAAEENAGSETAVSSTDSDDSASEGNEVVGHHETPVHSLVPDQAAIHGEHAEPIDNNNKHPAENNLIESHDQVVHASDAVTQENSENAEGSLPEEVVATTVSSVDEADIVTHEVTDASNQEQNHSDSLENEHPDGEPHSEETSSVVPENHDEHLVTDNTQTEQSPDNDEKALEGATTERSDGGEGVETATIVDGSSEQVPEIHSDDVHQETQNEISSEAPNPENFPVTQNGDASQETVTEFSSENTNLAFQETHVEHSSPEHPEVLQETSDEEHEAQTNAPLNNEEGSAELHSAADVSPPTDVPVETTDTILVNSDHISSDAVDNEDVTLSADGDSTESATAAVNNASQEPITSDTHNEENKPVSEPTAQEEIKPEPTVGSEGNPESEIVHDVNEEGVPAQEETTVTNMDSANAESTSEHAATENDNANNSGDVSEEAAVNGLAESSGEAANSEESVDHKTQLHFTEAPIVESEPEAVPNTESTPLNEDDSSHVPIIVSVPVTDGGQSLDESITEPNPTNQPVDVEDIPSHIDENVDTNENKIHGEVTEGSVPSSPETHEDEPATNLEQFKPEAPQEDIQTEVPKEEVYTEATHYEVHPEIPQEEIQPQGTHEEDQPDVPQEEVHTEVPQEQIHTEATHHEVQPEIPQEELHTEVPEEEFHNEATHHEVQPEIPHEEVLTEEPQEEAYTEATHYEVHPEIPQEELHTEVPQEETYTEVTRHKVQPEIPQEEAHTEVPQEEAYTEVTHHEVKPDTPQEQAQPDAVQEEVHTGIPQEEVHTEATHHEVQPEIPQEEAQPQVPQEDVQPEVAQEEVQPQVPQEDAQPEIAQEEIQPHVTQEEVQPQVPQEEVQPEVPQEEVQPQVQQEEELEKTLLTTEVPHTAEEETTHIELHIDLPVSTITSEDHKVDEALSETAVVASDETENENTSATTSSPISPEEPQLSSTEPEYHNEPVLDGSSASPLQNLDITSEGHQQSGTDNPISNDELLISSEVPVGPEQHEDVTQEGSGHDEIYTRPAEHEDTHASTEHSFDILDSSTPFHEHDVPITPGPPGIQFEQTTSVETEAGHQDSYTTLAVTAEKAQTEQPVHENIPHSDDLEGDKSTAEAISTEEGSEQPAIDVTSPESIEHEGSSSEAPQVPVEFHSEPSHTVDRQPQETGTTQKPLVEEDIQTTAASVVLGETNESQNLPTNEDVSSADTPTGAKTPTSQETENDSKPEDTEVVAASEVPTKGHEENQETSEPVINTEDKLFETGTGTPEVTPTVVEQGESSSAQPPSSDNQVLETSVQPHQEAESTTEQHSIPEQPISADEGSSENTVVPAIPEENIEPDVTEKIPSVLATTEASENQEKLGGPQTDLPNETELSQEGSVVEETSSEHSVSHDEQPQPETPEATTLLSQATSAESTSESSSLDEVHESGPSANHVPAETEADQPAEITTLPFVEENVSAAEDRPAGENVINQDTLHAEVVTESSSETVHESSSEEINSPEINEHSSESPISGVEPAQQLPTTTLASQLNELGPSSEHAVPLDNGSQHTEISPVEVPSEPGVPSWTQKPVEHHTTPEPTHLSEDTHYPSGYEQDYEDDDGASYGPGTCRYGGKVYLSAQQIPRDDPCDFCFCFRSDIICLQQSCPPPIKGCYQETIKGFCCPRYECHVSMATMLNLTTTTTTTTTTLPPHFFAHAYNGAATRAGCQVKGVAYNVGDRIPSTSGPCLECRCGANGQMKCEPTVCGPQEALLRQVMDAAAVSRRR